MTDARLPHPSPANDPPQLRTTRWIASQYGFSSPRAVTDWCRKRKIPYTRDGGFNWIDENLVRAAIARGRTVVVVTPPPASSTVAGWFDATIGATIGKGSSRG